MPSCVWVCVEIRREVSRARSCVLPVVRAIDHAVLETIADTGRQLRAWRGPYLTPHWGEEPNAQLFGVLWQQNGQRLQPTASLAGDAKWHY